MYCVICTSKHLVAEHIPHAEAMRTCSICESAKDEQLQLDRGATDGKREERGERAHAPHAAHLVFSGQDSDALRRSLALFLYRPQSEE